MLKRVLPLSFPHLSLLSLAFLFFLLFDTIGTLLGDEEKAILIDIITLLPIVLGSLIMMHLL